MKTIYFLFVLTALSALNTPSNAQEPCHFVPVATANSDTVIYTYDGGSLQSFGCAQIDPTYWISGGAISITVDFMIEQEHPMFRVWGMNNDDVASLEVNGTPYFLDGTSASIAPKVVCGLSPGPDGTIFNVDGNMVGANSNGDGNYSYSDITINQDGVLTIKVSGLTGAGWGFGGVGVDCPLGVAEESTTLPMLFPNPSDGYFCLQNWAAKDVQLFVYNSEGELVAEQRFFQNRIDLTSLPTGYYILKICSDHEVLNQPLIIQR